MTATVFRQSYVTQRPRNRNFNNKKVYEVFSAVSIAEDGSVHIPG